MDTVHSNTAYNIHVFLWITAVFNINDIAVTIYVHTQWLIELLELYKTCRCYDTPCNY
jgi:hypothetical protein